MKPGDSHKEPNQGEGDRVSARHYNREVREFIADGKVEPAAREAKDFVEREPDEAARAEQKAKHGPHTRVSIDDLLAKSKSVVERVGPALRRAAAKVRSRFHRS